MIVDDHACGAASGSISGDVAAGLPCYFRGKKASFGVDPVDFRASRPPGSAVAAASPGPFSDGNFDWIPRVTGSPSTPPEVKSASTRSAPPRR